MLTRSFKVENRIDNVLESFRPGDRAVFRDVPDQENGDVIFLRPEQQLRRDFPHLSDAARRHLEFFTERSLNGIDDDDSRAKLFAAARIFSTDISA